MNDVKQKIDKALEDLEKVQVDAEVDVSDTSNNQAEIVKNLEAKCAEFEAKYKRALADFSNLERQTKEFQIRFAKLATQGFVEELVEPYDHLKLAAAHVQDKGLDMVMGQFKNVFESQGLKEIFPEGKAFDAQSMEAIDTAEGEDGKVVKVVSSGYELNGIVIKPAKVIVGKK